MLKKMPPFFLLQPAKADLMWHDLKRFAVITRGYAENMKDGIYGPVPSSFRDPLKELWSMAAYELLYIENVMVLTKLDLRQTGFSKEAVPVKNIVDHGKTFIEPILAQKKIRLAINHQDGTIETNARYIVLILENLLFVAANLPKVSRCALRINAKKRELLLECNPQKKIAIPKGLFSRTNLFTPAEHPLVRHSLFLVTAKMLAARLGASLVITSGKTLQFRLRYA